MENETAVTTLSPAAQAVLDAYIDEDRAGRLAIAAVLRAAADQLPLSRGWDTGVYWSVRQLLAIAAELEGAN
ncbi:MAG: hypothetical protein WCK51_15880 [Armatimonadota bacterium]